mgnify:CR=1 FL=1
MRNGSCTSQPMLWKIGCSGYHYREWEGLFYPADLPRNKWFDFYCEHFSTIELNTTFYKFPRIEALQKWRQRSPPAFSFSVKAPRIITHFKKFKDAQRYLTDFYEATRKGLEDKLGCVLFQFPANFQYDEPKLQRIIGLLDLTIPNVLEFRHTSWFNEAVFSALRQHQITFCSMDHPAMPDYVVKTSSMIYHRLHGVPHIYVSRYPTQKLDDLARRIQESGEDQTVYVYFNNTTEGAAVVNARELLDIAELVH